MQRIILTLLLTLLIQAAPAQSLLSGKRILWIGTSIPAQSSYPRHASEAVGCSVSNRSVGASFITIRPFSGKVENHTGYSLSLTRAEKDSLYRPWVSEGIIDEHQLDVWKYTSYESLIMPHLDTTDIVIIDHGFNDGDLPILDEYSRGRDSVDWQSEDRTTFIGAFNYLYRRILAAKPDVIVALGGYFQHECLTAYRRSEAVAEVCRWIAEHYDLPLLDVWNHTDLPDGFAPHSSQYLADLNARYGTSYTPRWTDADGNITYFQQFCPDGVHPWSDPTGRSERVLDSIFTELLPQRIEPYLAEPHVTINEVMTNNVHSLLYNHRLPDSWIELYNPTSRTVSLKGWRLGTSPDYDAAYAFHFDKYVPKGAYAIICCDGRDDHWEHTSFVLPPSRRGTLYLWDAQGALVDSVTYPALPAPDIAYGRILDGTPHWQLKVTPTPGQANPSAPADKQLAMPLIELVDGVIRLSSPVDNADNGARLHYTLDGSQPDSTSPSLPAGATLSLRADTSLVVRARMLSPYALPSPVVTRSVIRHPRQSSLPVVSLSTDADYLYSTDDGILLGNDWADNCFKHWPRPIHLEYFESAGSTEPQLSQLVQADTYGTGSLLFSQKSLTLTALDRYGSDRIASASFWPSKPQVTNVRSLILRNGGGRALDTRFEDAFVQQLFGTRLDTLGYQAYRPVIVYINGRYRGIYELRETADRSWVESNRGIPADDVTLVESLTTTDEAFRPVLDLLDDPAATLADFARLIDIPRLIDYLCAEAYATNTDFPHTNVTLWRDGSESASRFVPLLRNLDYLSTTSPQTNWFNYLTLFGDDASSVRNPEAHRLFIRLLSMPDFHDAFIDRMQVCLGDFCRPEVTVPMVRRMRDEIAAEVGPTFVLMNERPDYQRDFVEQIDNRLIPYCETRPLLLAGNLNTTFRLGGVYHLVVQGANSVNGHRLTEGDFRGCCFASRPVRLGSDTIRQWQIDVVQTDGKHQHYRLPASPCPSFLPSDYGSDIDSVIVRPVPSPAQADISGSYSDKIRQMGYDPATTRDWSRESVIDLPQPRLAYINLRSRYGIPYTKTSDFRDTIEYYDAAGNYFMKRAIVNVQGATSTSFPKRNVKLQLIDDEWQGDVVPTVDFDGWVKQDHFHLKAFYTDWLRGVCIVGYQLFDQMEQQMPASSNRIWKRAGVEGHKNARCYPDGFPCMMFLNGEFWGISTWQLAKHRRNMAQEKHNALHIHLDGNMSETNFWLDNLKWSSLEVRNPKDLYDMEGNPYDDGDELIDSSSPYFDQPGDTQEVREAKQRSAQVKQAIVALTRRVDELSELKQGGASAEEIRQAIARHFDVTSMVNYLVFSTVTSNYDGFAKNWQWLTYDGGETWHVAPYDLDCTFGNYHEGTLLFPAQFSYSDSDYRFGISRRGIATWFWDYYFDEIRTRYAELRDCGILSPKNISGLIHDWHDRIGSDLYAMEWTRWPDAQCISQTITNPGWIASDDWTDHFNRLPEWKEDVTYHPGDICRLSRRVWIATTVTTGVRPYQQLGFTDSLDRLDTWIDERIALEDSYFGYTAPPESLEQTAAPTATRAIAIFSPDGTRRSQLQHGINIVRYDDGTSRIIMLK